MSLFLKHDNPNADCCETCKHWEKLSVIKGRCNNKGSICFNTTTWDDDYCGPDSYERDEK